MSQAEETKSEKDKFWEEACKLRCQKCMTEIMSGNILYHHYLLDGDVACKIIGYCCHKCKIVVRDDMNSVYDLEKGFAYAKDTYNFEILDNEQQNESKNKIYTKRTNM